MRQDLHVSILFLLSSLSDSRVFRSGRKLDSRQDEVGNDTSTPLRAPSPLCDFFPSPTYSAIGSFALRSSRVLPLEKSTDSRRASLAWRASHARMRASKHASEKGLHHLQLPATWLFCCFQDASRMGQPMRSRRRGHLFDFILACFSASRSLQSPSLVGMA